MSWIIYGIGVLIAYIMSTICHYNDIGEITIGDLFLLFIVSLFSYLTIFTILIALFIESGIFDITIFKRDGNKEKK